MGEGRLVVCASCGETFESEWSKYDAMDEYLDTFTAEHIADVAGDKMEVICDDCYDLIMARIRAEAPELLRPEARGGE
jgi:hypothetical protein